MLPESGLALDMMKKGHKVLADAERKPLERWRRTGRRRRQGRNNDDRLGSPSLPGRAFAAARVFAE